MYRFFFLFVLVIISRSLFSQNISIDKSPREIIGMGSTGDTVIYLCQSKIKDSLIYPVFYKKDSLIWPGKTYFHKQDFDSLRMRMMERGNNAPVSGFILKQKADIHLKKSYRVKVSMMPTFGWYVGKKKPGRYKLIGYSLKVSNEFGLCYDGMVFYYLQKQSFFKRFFKKRKLKKRINRLPVLLGVGAPEIILKNDIIQEGGQVKENYITFKLKTTKP